MLFMTRQSTFCFCLFYVKALQFSVFGNMYLHHKKKIKRDNNNHLMFAKQTKLVNQQIIGCLALVRLKKYIKLKNGYYDVNTAGKV